MERFNEFFSQIILTTPGDLSINIVYSYSFFSNSLHVIIYINALCVVECLEELTKLSTFKMYLIFLENRHTDRTAYIGGALLEIFGHTRH